MADALSRFKRVLERLTDEALRSATVLGFASIPFTVALSWHAVTDAAVVLGGTISGGPLFLAGLLAGYVYSDRPTPTRRAGVQTGLVGSLGVAIVYLSNSATTIAAGPEWVAGASLVLTPVAVGIGIALSVLVCVIGATIGEWLTTREFLTRRTAKSG